MGLKELVPLDVRVRVRDAVNRAVENSRLVQHAYRHHSELPVIYGPPERLLKAPDVFLPDVMLNMNSGTITLEPEVMIGHRVALITGVHDVNLYGVERHDGWPKEGRNIVVGRGAWIATGAIVLGPCTIGEHAVVAAGAVVTGDVEPYTVVGGVPARPLRTGQLRQQQDSSAR